MSAPITRGSHRQRMSDSSRDFREGVAYTCDVMRQELFALMLGGETIQDMMRRLDAEQKRLRADDIEAGP